MAFTVTGHGQGTTTSGATATKAPAATITVGSSIVVGVLDSSTAASGGSLTDSQGNTYTSRTARALNDVTSNGFGQMFTCVVTTQLTTSDLLTYTKVSGVGKTATLSILSATGGDTSAPYDSAVTANAIGHVTTTPTVTSGTPSVAGELLVAWAVSVSHTPTSDAGHSWSSPPLSGTSANAPRGVGANQINAGTGTTVWAPTTTLTDEWAIFVIGLKPPAAAVVAGFDPASSVLRSNSRKADFKSYDTLSPLLGWQNAGWEIPPFQPPFAVKPQRGSILKGDDGITAPFIYVPPAQSYAEFNGPLFQPPAALRARKGGNVGGDTGALAPLIVWVNLGNGPEGLIFQPPVNRRGTKGVGLKGDEGIVATFKNWLNAGWEIPPYQPPAYRQGTKGAILKGDDGIQATFNTWLNYGWEIPPYQPPAFRKGIKGAILKGDEGIVATFKRWINAGWEILPFQPPAFLRGTKGAILKGDQGAVAPFNPWLNAGWEIPPYQPPAYRQGIKGVNFKGDQGTQGKYVVWVNVGWEGPLFQPPSRIAVRKRAAGLLNDMLVYLRTFVISRGKKPLYLKSQHNVPASLWKGRD